MNDSIVKIQKRELQDEIDALGYNSLRYSLLNAENDHRKEWQLRIDFESEKYYVYALAERASTIGQKKVFQEFPDAKKEFIRKLKLQVEINKERVSHGEKPFYTSPVWDIVSS